VRHLLAPVARALAALAALAAPTGCYAPSLRDCTVTCDSERDCASGQVCGADGMCAAPAVAGRCAAPEVDAGVVDASGAHDASPPRDAATPDGPQLITLRVQVDGKGSVDVAGAGVCSTKDPSRGRCMYDIAPGIAQRVEAIAIETDQQFVSWTSVACAGQDAVCTFVPLATTTVIAKFGRSAGVR
jgi:hypothetical protein